MSSKHLLTAPLLLALSGLTTLALAQTQPKYPDVAAQGVYKCPLAKGGFEYTDRPCLKQGGKLVMQPDQAEAIDNLLYAGHTEQAQTYADEHGVPALYQTRLKVYQDRMAQVQARQQQDALAAEQRQAEADERAALSREDRTRALADENDRLRQDNAQYQNELEDATQPVAYGSGLGYGYGEGYGYGGIDGYPGQGGYHEGHHHGDGDGSHGHRGDDDNRNQAVRKLSPNRPATSAPKLTPPPVRIEDSSQRRR